MAISMSENNQHALVILNRSSETQTLSNGLSWAGLPSVGMVQDIVNEQAITIVEDQLTVTIQPFASQIWIWE